MSAGVQCRHSGLVMYGGWPWILVQLVTACRFGAIKINHVFKIRCCQWLARGIWFRGSATFAFSLVATVLLGQELRRRRIQPLAPEQRSSRNRCRHTGPCQARLTRAQRARQVRHSHELRGHRVQRSGKTRRAERRTSKWEFRERPTRTRARYSGCWCLSAMSSHKPRNRIKEDYNRRSSVPRTRRKKPFSPQ